MIRRILFAPFAREYALTARLQRFSVRLKKYWFFSTFLKKTAFLKGTSIFKNLRYDAKYLKYDRNTPFMTKKIFEIY